MQRQRGFDLNIGLLMASGRPAAAPPAEVENPSNALGDRRRRVVGVGRRRELRSSLEEQGGGIASTATIAATGTRSCGFRRVKSSEGGPMIRSNRISTIVDGRVGTPLLHDGPSPLLHGRRSLNIAFDSNPSVHQSTVSLCC